MGIFAKIKAGLAKTRDSVMSSVDSVLKSFVKIDEDFFEELFEILVSSDMGVATSDEVMERLRERVKDGRVTDPQAVRGLLKDILSEMLEGDEAGLALDTKPSVILVVGVNGVGKTTTIAKLAHNLREQGKSVLLAAGDTFRAAAIEQLQIWAQRARVDIVKHQEGSDPAAVVFDAISAAKARGIDVLICDTAGRLHNKKNLMDELAKISRVIDRELPDASREVLIVIDATTGQNGLAQAKEFRDAAGITGIVLTKLDGTAKGGVVVAIKHEFGVPIKYVGVGEKMDDLQSFDARQYVDALFDES